MSKITLNLSKNQVKDEKQKQKQEEEEEEEVSFDEEPEPLPKLNLGKIEFKKMPIPEVNRTSSNPYQESTERTNIQDKMKSLLGEELGMSCEKSLYQYERTIRNKDFPDLEFSLMYKKHGLNLLRNLNPEASVKNEYLLPKVKNGDIRPDRLAELTPQELLPPKWESYREERRLEIQEEKNLKSQASGSDIFKCGKCKAKNTNWTQSQTRSLDEPQTIKIVCNECGNKWTTEG